MHLENLPERKERGATRARKALGGQSKKKCKEQEVGAKSGRSKQRPSAGPDGGWGGHTYGFVENKKSDKRGKKRPSSRGTARGLKRRKDPVINAG